MSIVLLSGKGHDVIAHFLTPCAREAAASGWTKLSDKSATSLFHTHTHAHTARAGRWNGGIARAASRDQSAGWRCCWWRRLNACKACPLCAVRSHGGTREWTWGPQRPWRQWRQQQWVSGNSCCTLYGLAPSHAEETRRRWWRWVWGVACVWFWEVGWRVGVGDSSKCQARCDAVSRCQSLGVSVTFSIIIIFLLLLIIIIIIRTMTVIFLMWYCLAAASVFLHVLWFNQLSWDPTPCVYVL